MQHAGVARRLDAGAGALEAALVAAVGAHPLTLCGMLLLHLWSPTHGFCHRPPSQPASGRRPSSVGTATDARELTLPGASSAPCNSSPARHNLQLRARRSVQYPVAALLMTWCGLRAAAGARGRGGLAEEAHHLVGLLEAAAHGEVRHGHPQRLLRDGVSGGGALRCHRR